MLKEDLQPLPYMWIKIKDSGLNFNIITFL
uniref:Uncharacterized protein n=1 Tax=Rhizophora mucronata TaxID=61149 RepID=A0A2P2QJK7_RHIMU